MLGNTEDNPPMAETTTEASPICQSVSSSLFFILSGFWITDKNNTGWLLANGKSFDSKKVGDAC